MRGRKQSLSHERVERSAAPMMTAIRDNYTAGPSSRDRVFENLNALAICAAYVIVGTGERVARQECRGFFDDALRQQIADLLRGGQSPGDPL